MPIPFNPPEPVYPTFGQSLGQGLQQGVVGGVNAYNDRLKMDEQAKLLQLQLFQYQQKQYEIANTNLEQNAGFMAKHGTDLTQQRYFAAMQQFAGEGQGQVSTKDMVEADRISGLGRKRSEALATPRSARPKINYVNVNGRMMKEVTDAEGKTISSHDMGSSGPFAAKIADANSSRGIAHGLMDQVDAGYKNLVTATDASGVPLQYGTKKLNEIAAIDPKAKAYLDTLPSKLSYMIRALGQTGVLTDEDIKMIREGLPNETDTLESASLKMEQVRETLDIIFDSRIRAYGGMGGEKPKADEGKGGGAVAAEPQFSRESDGIYVTPVGGKKRKATASDFKD